MAEVPGERHAVDLVRIAPPLAGGLPGVAVIAPRADGLLPIIVRFRERGRLLAGGRLPAALGGRAAVGPAPTPCPSPRGRGETGRDAERPPAGGVLIARVRRLVPLPAGLREAAGRGRGVGIIGLAGARAARFLPRAAHGATGAAAAAPQRVRVGPAAGVAGRRPAVARGPAAAARRVPRAVGRKRVVEEGAVGRVIAAALALRPRAAILDRPAGEGEGRARARAPPPRRAPAGEGDAVGPATRPGRGREAVAGGPAAAARRAPAARAQRVVAVEAVGRVIAAA